MKLLMLALFALVLTGCGQNRVADDPVTDESITTPVHKGGEPIKPGGDGDTNK